MKYVKFFAAFIGFLVRTMAWESAALAALSAGVFWFAVYCFHADGFWLCYWKAVGCSGIVSLLTLPVTVYVTKRDFGKNMDAILTEMPKLYSILQ